MWNRLKFGFVALLLLAAGTFTATSPAAANPDSYDWRHLTRYGLSCLFYMSHDINLYSYPLAITNPAYSGCGPTSKAGLQSSTPWTITYDQDWGYNDDSAVAVGPRYWYPEDSDHRVCVELPGTDYCKTYWYHDGPT